MIVATFLLCRGACSASWERTLVASRATDAGILANLVLIFCVRTEGLYALCTERACRAVLACRGRRHLIRFTVPAFLTRNVVRRAIVLTVRSRWAS